MPILELPHTPGCLVCGRENPHGLHLSLHVDEQGGMVSASFTPQKLHIGFEGIVHGGVIATVLDEAMVWAATWAGRRFCFCGELTVRFKHNIRVGEVLRVEARVDFARPKLIQTSAELRDQANIPLATASGKYVPLAPDQNRDFVNTLVDEPATASAAGVLRAAVPFVAR